MTCKLGNACRCVSEPQLCPNWERREREMSNDWEPGWLERQLKNTERRYRAIEFAREYPEIVNSVADEMGFDPLLPEIGVTKDRR